MHLPEELISLYIGCIQLLCLHLRGEGERRGGPSNCELVRTRGGGVHYG